MPMSILVCVWIRKDQTIDQQKPRLKTGYYKILEEQQRQTF